MGRLNDAMRMLKEKRFGFSMNEAMAGTHEFVDGHGAPGEHPLHFETSWGTKHIGPWINPLGEKFMVNDIEGVVTVGGLCVDAPCKGTLTLMYFSRAMIRYSFTFQVEGAPYLFVGEKRNIKPWNILVSHTTCFTTIVRADTGVLISRGLVFFNLASIPSFIASLRLD